MSSDPSRRAVLGAGALVSAAAISGRAQAAALPEAPTSHDTATKPPQHPHAGPDYQPVTTLNGWSLPFRMNGDWKEFHLLAEPVRRELAPGMVANLWGYNGGSPGPTIEAVEGDLVRIFVTNHLPEHTTVHWHGMHLTNGMDGVGGLTQPAIPPGKSFVYEFRLPRSGTFMYHPHCDEMVQMAMGMMGFFVVHPEDPAFKRVDRDYVFLMNAYLIEPGSYTPKVNEMLDFNLWTFNSRVYPGIDPIVARQDEKLRIRFGNLTMTNHPIHIHGHSFRVSGTDGGWVEEAASWPESAVDCAVGQMRAVEFVANNPGDWAMHCHKSHHTMNAMGHQVRTYIGANMGSSAKAIAKLAPGYMPMGSKGMDAMAGMGMQLPENTLPMMAGRGQFGDLEMGGMFTTVKVRPDLAADDYRDPGPYKNPPGSVAFEWTGALPEPARAEAPQPEKAGFDVVDPRRARHPMNHD